MNCMLESILMISPYYIAVLYCKCINMFVLFTIEWPQ